MSKAVIITTEQAMRSIEDVTFRYRDDILLWRTVLADPFASYTYAAYCRDRYQYYCDAVHKVISVAAIDHSVAPLWSLAERLH